MTSVIVSLDIHRNIYFNVFLFIFSTKIDILWLSSETAFHNHSCCQCIVIILIFLLVHRPQSSISVFYVVTTDVNLMWWLLVRKLSIVLLLCALRMIKLNKHQMLCFFCHFFVLVICNKIMASLPDSFQPHLLLVWVLTWKKCGKHEPSKKEVSSQDVCSQVGYRSLQWEMFPLRIIVF